MLRIIFIMLVLAEFVYSSMEEKNVSRVTHAGGLMCGVACSVILLPDIESKILRRCMPFASGLIIIISFLVMPWCAYSRGINGATCSPLRPHV